MEENKNTVEKLEEVEKTEKVKVPCGCFCGHNCADGCVYWEPYTRDHNGRQWCNWYDAYYYPSEREGCLSFK